MRRLLTVNDVAERVALSPLTIRRRIRSGEITAIKLGEGERAPVRISEQQLQSWLSSRTTGKGAR